jgi:phosphate uptake regulator
LSITRGKTEEARKIQFSGKSSYMLALPKKWVEELGLKGGDQVAVARQSDASLLITPGSKILGTAREEITFEIQHPDTSGSILRKLISAYLLGYSLIRVRGKQGPVTSSQRDVIKDAARRHLVGTEIVAESTEGVVLQVLLSYPELSLKDAVKRMLLITSSMHKDAMLALQTASKDSAASVVKSDDEVDRFSLYVIRQLNIAVQNDLILKEIGLSSRRDCLDYRLIVKSIERVADHAARIAEAVMLLDKPVDQNIIQGILEMSRSAVKLFDDSGLALFKNDYAAADKVVEETRFAAQTQKDLLNKIGKARTGAAQQTLPLIIEDIRRTAEYSGDIAEVVLNLTTEQTNQRSSSVKRGGS